MARHMVAMTNEEWMELIKAQLDLLTSPLMHSLTLQSIEDIGFYWDSYGLRSIKNSKPKDGSFAVNGLSLDLRVICPEARGGAIMTKFKYNNDDPHDQGEVMSITQNTFGLSRDRELVTIEIFANITQETPSCCTNSPNRIRHWIPKYASVSPLKSFSDLAEFTPDEIWYGLAEAVKTLVRKREESMEPLRELRREIEATESSLKPLQLIV